METKLSFKEKFAFKYIFNEKRIYKRWYGRYFLFGMDYGRLNRVIPRINTWLDWCREWTEEGEKVEDIAERELRSGNLYMAQRLFHQAVACYHIGQHFFFVDPRQKEASSEKGRNAYQKAIQLSPENKRPVKTSIPYNNTVIPGYFFGAKEKNRPIVIQINGMDNMKEAENHYVAQYFMPHGYNFFAFDGPGQGEMWANAKFDVATYPNAVSTVIDWLEAHNSNAVDMNAVVLFGFSLGGFLAPYSAAFDKRVKYVIANSGWANIGGIQGIKKLKLHKKGVFYLTGYTDIKQASKKFDLNIAKAPDLECPLLYFHAGRDEIIENPEAQAKMVMEWAKGEKELRFYPNAAHCTVDYLDEVLPYTLDWLSRQMRTESSK